MMALRVIKIKNIFESTFEFLDQEVENCALSSNIKLCLEFLSIITSKKHGTLEKVKRIIKIAVTTAIKSRPE